MTEVDDIEEKPFSIHYRTRSHPRLGITIPQPYRFHSSYATADERNDAFDLLSRDMGRTHYIKIGP